MAAQFKICRYRACCHDIVLVY